MFFKSFFTKEQDYKRLEIEINAENPLQNYIDTLKSCKALTLKGELEWDGIKLIRQLRNLSLLDLSSIKKVRKLQSSSLPHDTLTEMKKIKEIIIPELVPVDSLAITKCPLLEKIIIPQGVALVNPGMAYDCGKFTQFIVEEGNAHFFSVEGAILSKDGKKLISVPCGIKGTYTVPDSVNEILDGSFFGCTFLEQVVCDDEKVKIGEKAFRYVNVKVVKQN